MRGKCGRRKEAGDVGGERSSAAPSPAPSHVRRSSTTHGHPDGTSWIQGHQADLGWGLEKEDFQTVRKLIPTLATFRLSPSGELDFRDPNDPKKPLVLMPKASCAVTG